MVNENRDEIKSQIMTTQEISKYLGVHEMTVYRWLKKGILPGFKIGGRWRSKKDLLDDYLMSCMNMKLKSPKGNGH